MAENDFFDRIHGPATADDVVGLYDDWAERYDADVGGAGYVTPRRVAVALAGTVADTSTPVLDYGCGTGLSGVALSGAGFTRIDGAHLPGAASPPASSSSPAGELRHALRALADGAPAPRSRLLGDAGP